MALCTHDALFGLSCVAEVFTGSPSECCLPRMQALQGKLPATRREKTSGQIAVPLRLLRTLQRCFWTTSTFALDCRWNPPSKVQQTEMS